jgi:hypothetical protein
VRSVNRAIRLMMGVTEGGSVASEGVLPSLRGNVERRAILEYAQSVSARYLAASKVQKGVMRDEFCQTTGRHRKSAVRLLRHPRAAESRRVRVDPIVWLWRNFRDRVQADWRTRRRSRSNPARPYIWRLISLSLVIWPSVWALLQLSAIPAWTAGRSCSM